MVGPREATTWYCAICGRSFTSKIAYTQHMATHDEPEAPKLPCPGCSWTFTDSHALEQHKIQSGHDGETFPCEVCGETFQTQVKFKKHREFPSPCYADADISPRSRARSAQNTSSGQPRQEARVQGYVDLDTPVAASDPHVLPYGGDSPDPTTRPSTPSDTSVGEFCRYCKKTFKSRGLYDLHVLSCASKQLRPAATGTARANPGSIVDGMQSLHIAPARSLAEAVRPLLPAWSDRLHQASPAVSSSQLRQNRPTAPTFQQFSQNTRSSMPNTLTCGLYGCEKSFQSRSALDQHQSASHNSSQSQISSARGDFACGIGGCRGVFQSPVALEQHKKANHILLCDVGGCGKPFQTEAELNQHKQDQHDIGDQRPVVPDEQPRPSPVTTTAASRPAPGAGTQHPTVQNRQPRPTSTASAVVSRPTPGADAPRPAVQNVQPRPSPAAPTASPRPVRTPALSGTSPSPVPLTATSGSFVCGVKGCQTPPFRSEAGLNNHKKDAHGIGGQSLNLHGSDSWMLPQNVRNQLREAVLRSSGPPPQRRAPTNGGRSGPPPAVNAPRHFSRAPLTSHQPPRNYTTPMPLANASSSTVRIGGFDEIKEGDGLRDNFMRMLINADISVQHQGQIVYNGVSYKRIPVDEQNGVVGQFDELIKRPKYLQAMTYVDPPETFKDRHERIVDNYCMPEFANLPEPETGSPRLRIVVLYCSRILLANGCEEVVKIAAIDCLTGRPLMNYLVCTDPKATVQDWRTATTGLSSYQQMESLRSQGRFKVLKGWLAARAALFKFIDANTILIGYNLRFDLDALRIEHGRAIDLIELVERAAEGRLSRGQLSLDTLMRDLPRMNLPVDSFGRDCLQDAFAVRHLALMYLMKNDDFVRYAKAKALEYARVQGL